MPKDKTFSVDGKVVDISADKLDSFLKDTPNAVEVQTFVAGRKKYSVPINEVQGFLKDVPWAKPLKKKEPSVSSGGASTSTSVPKPDDTGITEVQLPVADVKEQGTTPKPEAQQNTPTESDLSNERQSVRPDSYFPAPDRLTSKELSQIDKNLSNTLYQANLPNATEPKGQTEGELNATQRREQASLQGAILSLEQQKQSMEFTGDDLTDYNPERVKLDKEIQAKREQLKAYKEPVDFFDRIPNSDKYAANKPEIQHYLKNMEVADPEGFKMLNKQAEKGLLSEQDYFSYVVNPALLTQMEISNQDYEILKERGVVYKAQMAATIMRDMEELQAAIEANPQDEQLKATFMQKDEQLKTLQDPQIDELMNVIAKGDSVKQSYGEAILAMGKEIGLVQPQVTDITEDMPKNVLKQLDLNREYRKDLGEGSLKAFGESVAGVMDDIDALGKFAAAQTGLGDILLNPGWGERKGAAGQLATGLRDKLVPLNDMPDTWTGNMLSTAIGMTGMLVEMAAFPELRIARLAKATGGVVRGIPAFGVMEGTLGGVREWNKLVSSGNPQDFNIQLESLWATEIGTANGIGLHYVGAFGGEVSKWVAKAVKNNFVPAAAGMATTGGMFTTLDAFETYITKGEYNWDYFKKSTAVGAGASVLSVPHIYAALKADVYKKAYTHFSTSSKDVIQKAQQMPATPEELLTKAVELNKEGKENEANILNTMANVKMAAEDIVANPDKAKKDIEQSNLTDKEKEFHLNKIDETVKFAKELRTTEDKAITENQKRLNLPTDVSIPIADATGETLLKIEAGEPVVNARIKEASSDLYGRYKGLLAERNNHNRKFTTAQLDKAIGELEGKIQTLETKLQSQGETGEFTGVKEVIKPAEPATEPAKPVSTEPTVSTEPSPAEKPIPASEVKPVVEPIKPPVGEQPMADSKVVENPPAVSQPNKSKTGKEIEPNPEVKDDLDTVLKEVGYGERERLVYENLKGVEGELERVDAIDKIKAKKEKRIDDLDIEIGKIEDRQAVIDRELDLLDPVKDKKELKKLNDEYDTLQKKVNDIETEKESIEELKKQMDYLSDDVYDNPSSISDIINKIDTRLETRKAVKAGTDLFPEYSGIPEVEQKLKQITDEHPDTKPETIRTFAGKTESESKQLEPTVQVAERKAKVAASLKKEAIEKAIEEIDKVIEPEVKAVNPEVKTVADKYGWDAKVNDKGNTELFNKNGKMVATIQTKGDKYTILDSGGEKLMTGRGQIGKSVEKLLNEHFYAKEVKPVKEPKTEVKAEKEPLTIPDLQEAYQQRKITLEEYNKKVEEIRKQPEQGFGHNARPRPENVDTPAGVMPSPIPGGKPQRWTKMLQDLNKELSKAGLFGRIDFGSPSSKSRRGVYLPSSGAIRTRHAADVPAVTHELGHRIDDKYKVLETVQDGSLDAELSRLWVTGSMPPANHPDPLRYQRSEGFAEFLRAYMINPGDARLQFPGTYHLFETKTPLKVRQALDKYSNSIREWWGLSDAEKAGANVVDHSQETDFWGKVMAPFVNSGEFKVTWWDSFKGQWGTQYAVIQKAWDAVLKMKGIDDVLPSRDFMKRARLLLGHNRKLMAVLENGMIDSKGEILIDSKTNQPKTWDWLIAPFHDNARNYDQVISNKEYSERVRMSKRAIELVDKKQYEQVENDLKDLKKLPPQTLLNKFPKLVAKYQTEINTFMQNAIANNTPSADMYHADKRYDFTKDVLTGFGGGMVQDYDLAMKTVQDYEALKTTDKARYDMVAESDRRYKEVSNDVLKYMLDSERITKDAYDYITEGNRDYIAMKVIKDIDSGIHLESDGVGKKGEITSIDKSIIKKYEGSAHEKVNPYVSLLETMDRAIKESDRNTALNLFIDPLRNTRDMYDGEVEFLADIAYKVDSVKGGETITVYNKGEAEHWRLNKDLYDAMTKMNDASIDKFVRLFTTPMRWMRNSVTAFPTFQARNRVRDFDSRLVVGQGSVSYKDFQNRKKAGVNLELMGGGQFGYYFHNKINYYDFMDNKIREMNREKNNTILHPLKFAKKAGNAYMKILGESELQTRKEEYNSVYRKAKQSGLSDFDARIEAAFAARNLMDFGVQGKFMKVLNAIFPFTNARLRGFGVAMRAIRTRPLQTFGKFALYVAVPEALHALMISQCDDETKKKYYQLPAWRRDMCWNIPAGDGWVSIPKPFEFGLLASLFRRIYDHYEGDKTALSPDVLKFYKDNMLPINPQMLTGSNPIMDIAYGYDSFRNKDVIPWYEKNIKVSEREGTVRASQLGQDLQSLTSVQPFKFLVGGEKDARSIDFTIKTLFTYPGNWALKFSDIGRTDREDKINLDLTGFYTTDQPAFSKDVLWVNDQVKKYGINVVKGVMAQPSDEYLKALTPEQRNQFKTIASLRYLKELQNFQEAYSDYWKAPKDKQPALEKKMVDDAIALREKYGDKDIAKDIRKYKALRKGVTK